MRLSPGRLIAALLVVGSVLATVWLDVLHPDVLLRMVPLPDVRELHVDFDSFWSSAVALAHGSDIYATSVKLTNLNPPLMTVLLAPLAALDEVTAYRVWVGLSVLMVVGAMLVVARELRLGRAATALGLVGVLASSSLHGTLVLGQIYPVLLTGLVAGWIAERRGRPVLAAVLFGLVVALKPSLAPILLLPAVLRRWVPLRAGVASAAVASLVGVAVCGLPSSVHWLRIAFTEPVPEFVDNASFPGLAVRFGLPAAAGLAGGLVVLVATLLWAGRRRDRVEPAGPVLFAVLAAGLLFSPIAWHNYGMLLFPGLFLLIALGRGAAAAALLALAAIPVSWNVPDGPGPWLHGSLYFLILLGSWWVFLRSAEPATARAREPLAPVT